MTLPNREDGTFAHANHCQAHAAAILGVQPGQCGSADTAAVLACPPPWLIPLLLVMASRTKAADWSTPVELKADFREASILKNGRVVVNIADNRFRLVARINFHYRVLDIRFVGTHSEYNAIDADII